MALTAWGQRIDEALDDGQWHLVEDVIVAAMGAVPPGVAFRRRERNRTRTLVAGANGPRPERETAVATAAGARDLVRQLIDSRIRRGTAERWGDKIRRRP